ncbi:MAG TPA: hypothetical protein VJM33_02540 [Microthrixaceae bacterium]|nr:hypothetical protein [Microthrixaceae bacterium]
MIGRSSPVAWRPVPWAISTCPAVVQVAVTVVETGRDHRQAIDVADEVAHRAVG